MSISEYTKCPKCESKLVVLKGNPLCPRCGYKVPPFDSSNLSYKSLVFKNAFSLALEITKGYAVSRSFMHAAMKKEMRLNGSVLDLGSGKKPSYMNIVKKENVLEYYKADGNEKNTPDIIVNFEETLPFASNSFDSVLLMNVLEHVYDYKKLVSEIKRILKPKGKIFFYVPFFIKVHGSPFDFFRYTENALFKLFYEEGYEDVKMYSSGGFFKMLSEAFNWLSQIKIGYLLFPLYLTFSLLDGLFDFLTKGNYSRTIPIGYFGQCKKK